MNALCTGLCMRLVFEQAGVPAEKQLVSLRRVRRRGRPRPRQGAVRAAVGSPAAQPVLRQGPVRCSGSCIMQTFLPAGGAAGCGSQSRFTAGHVGVHGPSVRSSRDTYSKRPGWQRHVYQSFLGGGLNCLYPTSHVRQGAVQKQQRLQQPIILCLSVGMHVQRVANTRVESNVTQAARSCHIHSQTARTTQIYKFFLLTICSGCNQIADVSDDI
jgi:hypothetical protein